MKTPRPLRIVFIGSQSPVVSRMVDSIIRELVGFRVEVSHVDLEGAHITERISRVADLVVSLGETSLGLFPRAVDRMFWNIPDPTGRGPQAVAALETMLRFRLAVLLREYCIDLHISQKKPAVETAGSCWMAG